MPMCDPAEVQLQLSEPNADTHPTTPSRVAAVTDIAVSITLTAQNTEDGRISSSCCHFNQAC